MMRRTIAGLAVIIAGIVAPVAAQQGALDTAASTLGAARITTLQFTGSGANFSVGQNYTAAEAWPRVTVKQYTAAINYDTASMRVELLREMGAVMPRGGRVQTLYGRVGDAENRAAFATLHEVLVASCRLLAPFAPYVTDWIHRELTGEMVHLAAYVRGAAAARPDAALEEAMTAIRALASAGRAARETAKVNVRQPLARMVCVTGPLSAQASPPPRLPGSSHS